MTTPKGEKVYTGKDYSPYVELFLNFEKKVNATLENTLSELQNSSSEKRSDAASALKDLFDYGDLSEVDFNLSINKLIDQTTKEPNKEVMESMLNAILEGISSRSSDSDEINFESLIHLMPSLSKMFIIEYALPVVALSHTKKFIPVIESYTYHQDPEVKEAANAALYELSKGQ